MSLPVIRAISTFYGSPLIDCNNEGVGFYLHMRDTGVWNISHDQFVLSQLGFPKGREIRNKNSKLTRINLLPFSNIFSSLKGQPSNVFKNV